MRVEDVIAEAVWRWETGESTDKWEDVDPGDQGDYRIDAARRVLRHLADAGYVVLDKEEATRLLSYVDVDSEGNADDYIADVYAKLRGGRDSE